MPARSGRISFFTPKRPPSPENMGRSGCARALNNQPLFPANFTSPLRSHSTLNTKHSRLRRLGPHQIASSVPATRLAGYFVLFRLVSSHFGPMSPRGALPAPVFWPLKRPKIADFGVTLPEASKPPQLPAFTGVRGADQSVTLPSYISCYSPPPSQKGRWLHLSLHCPKLFILA